MVRIQAWFSQPSHFWQEQGLEERVDKVTRENLFNYMFKAGLERIGLNAISSITMMNRKIEIAKF